jgi:hypothetical protein
MKIQKLLHFAALLSMAVKRGILFLLLTKESIREKRAKKSIWKAWGQIKLEMKEIKW